MNPGPPPFHDGVHLWHRDPRPPGRPGVSTRGPAGTTRSGCVPRTEPAGDLSDIPAQLKRAAEIPAKVEQTDDAVQAGSTDSGPGVHPSDEPGPADPPSVVLDPVEVLVFSLLSPPPVDPPVHAAHPHLWRIQLHWWWRHTPAHLAASCCAFCTRPWPCPSWLHWDDLLRHNSRATRATGTCGATDNTGKTHEV